MPVILIFRRLKQEDHESKSSTGTHSKFEASLGYIVRCHFKNSNNKEGQILYMLNL